jgi:hypothetical protein
MITDIAARTIAAIRATRRVKGLPAYVSCEGLPIWIPLLFNRPETAVANTERIKPN